MTLKLVLLLFGGLDIFGFSIKTEFEMFTLGCFNIIKYKRIMTNFEREILQKKVKPVESWSSQPPF